MEFGRFPGKEIMEKIDTLNKTNPLTENPEQAHRKTELRLQKNSRILGHESLYACLRPVTRTL